MLVAPDSRASTAELFRRVPYRQQLAQFILVSTVCAVNFFLAYQLNQLSGEGGGADNSSTAEGENSDCEEEGDSNAEGGGGASPHAKADDPASSANPREPPRGQEDAV